MMNINGFNEIYSMILCCHTGTNFKIEGFWFGFLVSFGVILTRTTLLTKILRSMLNRKKPVLLSILFKQALRGNDTE